MTKRKPKRAIIYLRVSGSSQADSDRDGFKRQRDKCLAWAKSAGCEVVAEYSDAITGTSGSDERPEFLRMLADIEDECKRYGVDNRPWEPPVIVIEGLDRLARAYGVQEQTLMLLMTKGLDVVAANVGENISEAWRGDPTKSLLVKILALLAEWERKMLVARMNAAKVRMRKEGLTVDGPPPYGDPSRPEEVRALAIMRQIDQHRYITLSKWLAMGGDRESHRKRITDKDIADCLNALGYKPRGNKSKQNLPWHWRVVWDILSRPRRKVTTASGPAGQTDGPVEASTQ